MQLMLKNGIFIATLMLSGCATTQNSDTESDNNDPFESLNRVTYSFNSAIDKAVLRPIAKGYDTVAPEPVKIGVSNFYSNLEEVPTVVNDILQGKIYDAFSDLGRFIINTTLGLAGLIDVASDLGFEKHDEDFAQTLGAWGFESGPYLMLPIFGPSSIRGLVRMPVDSYSSLTQDVDHISTRNSIYFMEIVDLRYRLLALDEQLEDALDEYSFVRDAYRMRREYLVYDGDPPEEDDFYDEDCEDDEDCDDEFID